MSDWIGGERRVKPCTSSHPSRRNRRDPPYHPEERRHNNPTTQRRGRDGPSGEIGDRYRFRRNLYLSPISWATRALSVGRQRRVVVRARQAGQEAAGRALGELTNRAASSRRSISPRTPGPNMHTQGDASTNDLPDPGLPWRAARPPIEYQAGAESDPGSGPSRGRPLPAPAFSHGSPRRGIGSFRPRRSSLPASPPGVRVGSADSTGADQPLRRRGVVARGPRPYVTNATASADFDAERPAVSTRSLVLPGPRAYFPPVSICAARHRVTDG